jgi:hypothetical protein
MAKKSQDGGRAYVHTFNVMYEARDLGTQTPGTEDPKNGNKHMVGPWTYQSYQSLKALESD